MNYCNLIIGKKLLKIKAYELDQVIKELRYSLILNNKIIDDLKKEVFTKDEYSL